MADLETREGPRGDEAAEDADVDRRLLVAEGTDATA